VNSDPGLHAAVGRTVNASAYDRYIGYWSRLFVPSLLAAAEIATGHRVLDVASGTGEAAVAAISLVGGAGAVIGADISAAMLGAARARLPQSYQTIVTDGQALAFRDASFDAVICQLGLMFFPNPGLGLGEFHRVLRRGGRAAVCVISTSDRAPMWGVLSEALSRRLPDQQELLNLSFSLADPESFEQMFDAAGFHDIRVAKETVTELSSRSTISGHRSRRGSVHCP
jgi:ubiquinone/menaquinone biosynthesis C-methylase UbiE